MVGETQERLANGVNKLLNEVLIFSSQGVSFGVS